MSRISSSNFREVVDFQLKKIMVDQDLALLGGGGGGGGGLREMNCQIIGFCPSLGVSTPTPVYEILDLPQRYSQSHW